MAWLPAIPEPEDEDGSDTVGAHENRKYGTHEFLGSNKGVRSLYPSPQPYVMSTSKLRICAAHVGGAPPRLGLWAIGTASWSRRVVDRGGCFQGQAGIVSPQRLSRQALQAEACVVMWLGLEKARQSCSCWLQNGFAYQSFCLRSWLDLLAAQSFRTAMSHRHTRTSFPHGTPDTLLCVLAISCTPNPETYLGLNNTEDTPKHLQLWFHLPPRTAARFGQLQSGSVGN